MREWLSDTGVTGSCQCDPELSGDTLTVGSDDCPGGGDLAAEADCRATAVDAIDGAPLETVVTVANGRERAYDDGAVALLTAASQFARRVRALDQRLADRAERDPLAAADEALGRAGAVADVAAESGLDLAAEQGATYEQVLTAFEGPVVSDARVRTEPPTAATLRDRRSTATEATVRVYETDDQGADWYHLEPLEQRFDPETTAALASAYEQIASATTRCPYAAARDVVRADETAHEVGTVLEKHTSGLGVVEDILADERVSDVFATAPVRETPLRVRADGDPLRTNVRLTAAGAEALASTFRRTSGRAFSAASPTLDATATVAGRQVRVAGVTDPVSDGVAFAFRAHDGTRWRLRDLVANGTVPAPVAGLLSVAVERGAACLVAGPRGAGKTTALGALLWELPPTVRTLVLEDTPELPVTALRNDGRDIQRLRTERGAGPAVEATTALRTALRLGDGALVVGEVRGEEAQVLYEAMRVGGGDDAVLGTIHGGSPQAVRDRLVSDLGVSERAIAATDLVVTLTPPESGGGRGIASVAEVIEHADGCGFEPLFERTGAAAASTGRIERGNSRLADELAGPTECYADIRDRFVERANEFEACLQPATAGTDG